jgi:protein involved in temperature-dependent protein secretion
VHRWNSARVAPKAACLALFWLTRWGRSAIDAQAVNDAVLAVSLARSLREDNERLRQQLTDLEPKLHSLQILVASREHELEDAHHALRKLELAAGPNYGVPTDQAGINAAQWLADAAAALAPALQVLINRAKSAPESLGQPAYDRHQEQA